MACIKKLFGKGQSWDVPAYGGLQGRISKTSGYDLPPAGPVAPPLPTEKINGNKKSGILKPSETVGKPGLSNDEIDFPNIQQTALPAVPDDKTKSVTKPITNIDESSTQEENKKFNKSMVELDAPVDINKRKAGVISDKLKEKPHQIMEIDVFEKDLQSCELIKKAITENEFLNNLMDDNRLELVTKAMKLEEFNENSFIITEGETGSYLYVSAEGEFEVIKGNDVLSKFGTGRVFGELAILYKAKRFASIKSLTKAKIWSLERKVFQRIMMKSGRLEKDENIKFLKKVTVLEKLDDEILTQIADLLRREFYATGATIIRQGDPGDKFYIIRGGNVTVTKRDGNGKERTVGQLKRADYFGEQALLHQDKRLANIYANPPGTECLTLDRVAFERYFGTIDEIRNHVPTDATDQSEFIPIKKVINEKYEHIELSDLAIVGTLGTGAFGRVELVQYNKKETFALKYLKKVDVVELQQTDHVYSEKDIMASCKSEFVIKLFKTFRDNKYIYFLMEPCLGGDVFTLLLKHKYFDEKTARFMTACVVEAFDYLHSNNMIYRDLKPENLMLDDKGYVKVVDFGFAKRLKPPEKTHTFVGTPEYTAPEVILSKGHDRAVDYWTLGIFIHELLVGKPTFRGKDQMKTYNMILRGIDVIELPDRIPKKAQALIRKLCRQIPSERLGCQKDGVKDIKKHTWFVGFDWDKLHNQQMEAPLKVPVKSNTDLSNFPPYQKDNDDPIEELSGWDKNF